MSILKEQSLNLLERLVGRRIEVPAAVPVATVVRHHVSKAFVPLLRGVVRAPFLKRVALPIFVGRNVHIRFGSLLSCGRAVNLGDGVRIDALSTQGIRLGDRVSLREGGIIQVSSHVSNLGVGVHIDDDVYIGPYAFIGAAAHVYIGKRTLVGPRLTIIAEGHQFEGDVPVYEQGVTRKGVHIGDDCWIGACVTVLDGVEIGRGSVIGAGSVVTKSLPEDSIAYGVPARLHRRRI